MRLLGGFWADLELIGDLERESACTPAGGFRWSTPATLPKSAMFRQNKWHYSLGILIDQLIIPWMNLWRYSPSR